MAFTFFFRDNTVLESAAELLVTETMGRCRVRVWNAGCAMGPETYTFLMLLGERMGKFAFETVSIDATDHEEHGDFGSIIRAGVYPHELLCRIPEHLLTKYFSKNDGGDDLYEVHSSLRARIRFIHHDLLTLASPGSGYSMVICKNVLLHFNSEQRIEVLSMFHDSLAENGLLVMEHTQKMPPELEGLFTNAVSDAQIYRKKSAVHSLVA